MRKFLAWLVVLLLVAALLAWWFGGRVIDERGYAPEAPMDATVIAPPLPDASPAEAGQAEAAPATLLPSERGDGLPSAPIPYDQLDRARPTDRPPTPRKDDEETIFY